MQGGACMDSKVNDTPMRESWLAGYWARVAAFYSNLSNSTFWT